MNEGEVSSGATFSPCDRYRYSLFRSWSRSEQRVVFVGLNPSTADAFTDDATIRRCVGFAKQWGYGGIVMLNLFAWRATDPRDLRKTVDPVGPGNDLEIARTMEWMTPRPRSGFYGGIAVACWGAHAFAVHRAGEVRRAIAHRSVTLHHLGLTREGCPRHPLYLRKDVTPTEWTD